MSRAGIIVGCCLGLVLLAACTSGPTADDTVTRFVEAVQAQDLDRLYCLMAGAATATELGSDPEERRANFDAWALSRLEAYLEGRDEGHVDLDEQGLTLVKLFALGKGTYFTRDRGRSSGPDQRTLESAVRFGYAHLDLSRLSPGTTFYVAGAPVGRIHPVRVPTGSREVSVEALETVRVRWTLVRGESQGECPGGWMVASVEPVAGSEVSTEITWVF